MKLIEIVETLKISKEPVGHIVDEYFDMRKKALFKVDATRAHNRPKTTITTQNSKNWASNCFRIHRILQIWLAPSDFFLFSDFKRMLAGKKFCADEEVIEETEAYFEANDKSCIIKMVSKNCMTAIIVVSPAKGTNYIQ